MRIATTLVVLMLVAACEGDVPRSMTPDPIVERCNEFDGQIASISWGGSGQASLVARVVDRGGATGDAIWIVDADTGESAEVGEAAVQGNASLGPDGSLVWVESAGGSVRELWQRDPTGAFSKLRAGTGLLEAFATTRGVIYAENVSESETAVRLVLRDGMTADLVTVSPRAGAVWVSPAGDWIATMRPGAAGGIGVLSAWTDGEIVELVAPTSLFLIGLTPDRSSFIYAPLDAVSELWTIPIHGGAPSQLAFDRPFNSLAISDDGRVAYVGELTGPAANRLCVLIEPIDFVSDG